MTIVTPLALLPSPKEKAVVAGRSENFRMQQREWLFLDPW
jgi:hypothetical protein